MRQQHGTAWNKYPRQNEEDHNRQQPKQTNRDALWSAGNVVSVTRTSMRSCSGNVRAGAARLLFGRPNAASPALVTVAGRLFPVSGGTSRFPHYAFGSLAAATFGWFSYIQAASVAPIDRSAAHLPAAGRAHPRPASFVLANFIVYWAGWSVYSTLMLVLLIGYALMFISFRFHLNPHQPRLDWAAATWLFPYLVWMGIISYLGGFPTGGIGILGGVGIFATWLVGGHGHLGLYWDLGVLTIFSLIIYYAAMARRLSSEQVDRNVHEVYPPPVVE